LDIIDWPGTKRRQNQSAQQALTTSQRSQLAAFTVKILVADRGEGASLGHARVTAFGKRAFGFQRFGSGSGNAGCGICAKSEARQLPIPSIEQDPTPMGSADAECETFGKFIEIVSLNLLRLGLCTGAEAFGKA
jgi:hypothetical protein